MVSHYGSYNFVLKKTKGTMQIALAYRNKWPCWTDYWFYHRMCSDEDIAEALMNDLPKVHILISEMMPMKRFRLAKIMANGPQDTEAVNCFTLTSQF
jgi:hypothetical protein